MAICYVKRNDLLPSYVAYLSDTGGGALDLTTAVSVKFVMRLRNSSTVKVNAAMTILSPATAGRVQYDFVVGDTDIAGIYDTELEVLWVSSKLQTFPNDGFGELIILEDLA